MHEEKARAFWEANCGDADKESWFDRRFLPGFVKGDLSNLSIV